jgi:hypothetical protein
MNVLLRRRLAGPSSARRRAAAVTTVLAAALTLLPAGCTDMIATGDGNLEILWPRNGATLYGEELLRARMPYRNLDDYEIYWYVDDGRERRMWNEWGARTPHKAYRVDTWFWDWRGRGPYTVGFVAEDRRGRVIARRTVRVYVQ